MAKLIFLGTSAAVPEDTQQYSSMLLIGEKNSLLIDCGWNPIVRLRKLGCSPEIPTDVLITHFHPDHAAGLPTFLISIWLLGRKQPLTIHGLESTIERIKALLKLFDWETLPDTFPIQYNPLPEKELSPVLNNHEFQILSSPVQHMISNIGLRIEFPNHEKVLAYSSDTAPCQQVVRLAKDADILIHEATGEVAWHSSAAQAGDIARQAGVKTLYLTHYSSENKNLRMLVEQAQESFSGAVHLAEDWMEISL